MDNTPDTNNDENNFDLLKIAKSNGSNFNISMRNGKWVAEFTGGADEASATFLEFLEEKLEERFDEITREVLDISYIGVKKIAGNTYKFTVSKSGGLKINGMSKQEFVNSLDEDELRTLADEWITLSFGETEQKQI